MWNAVECVVGLCVLERELCKTSPSLMLPFSTWTVLTDANWGLSGRMEDAGAKRQKKTKKSPLHNRTFEFSSFLECSSEYEVTSKVYPSPWGETFVI